MRRFAAPSATPATGEQQAASGAWGALGLTAAAFASAVRGAISESSPAAPQINLDGALEAALAGPGSSSGPSVAVSSTPTSTLNQPSGSTAPTQTMPSWSPQWGWRSLFDTTSPGIALRAGVNQNAELQSFGDTFKTAFNEKRDAAVTLSRGAVLALLEGVELHGRSYQLDHLRVKVTYIDRGLYPWLPPLFLVQNVKKNRSEPWAALLAVISRLELLLEKVLLEHPIVIPDLRGTNEYSKLNDFANSIDVEDPRNEGLLNAHEKFSTDANYKTSARFIHFYGDKTRSLEVLQLLAGLVRATGNDAHDYSSFIHEEWSPWRSVSGFKKPNEADTGSSFNAQTTSPVGSYGGNSYMSTPGSTLAP